MIAGRLVAAAIALALTASGTLAQSLGEPRLIHNTISECIEPDFRPWVDEVFQCTKFRHIQQIGLILPLAPYMGVVPDRHDTFRIIETSGPCPLKGCSKRGNDILTPVMLKEYTRPKY